MRGQISSSAGAFGVINSYVPPERLGADRWAALVAARARGAGAMCVVDAGTALTIDALDAHGVFRGGVILPGVALQRAALAHGTESVGAAAMAFGGCLAHDTAAAVAGGTLYGLAGAVDRVLDEQAQQLGEPATVLVTGGDGPRLLPLLRHAAEPVPDLVLHGVARLSDMAVTA
ncbi:MAG: type III pantothenate kinase [Comamonadaceae bacterium]|nr:type III pantothenate kinase [Comamonadaceae bacterium]